MTEQPERNAHSSEEATRSDQEHQPVTVEALTRRRLAESPLSESVRLLLEEALGAGEVRGVSTIGRVYLESVAVTRFRGVGPRAWLKLSPRPGVNLVVGRNGSGKSSIAEGIETAFTGVNMRWQGQHATRSSNWRNLHDTGGRPEIEVKLAIEGDAGRSTLTRTWEGDGFGDSQAELRRPGHGRASLDQLDWQQDLRDFRSRSHASADPRLPHRPVARLDRVPVDRRSGRARSARP